MPRLLIRYLITLILILLPACNLQSITPTIIPALPTAQPTQDSSTTNANDWTLIQDGLEQRVYIPNNIELARMIALRIDPNKYQFRAVYRAGDPLSITEWAQVEPNATAIINANFFDVQNNVLGLLVSDGVAYGQSYTDRGGTFFVQDGVANIQTFRNQTFQISALQQAVQAFPVLVENGQQAYLNSSDTRPSRRTIIGQDNDGNILIMVTPLLGLSLYDLSAYLPTTDLNLVTAINLDGGGSTMLRVPSIDLTLSSFDPVPSVLVVYPR